MIVNECFTANQDITLLNVNAKESDNASKSENFLSVFNLLLTENPAENKEASKENKKNELSELSVILLGSLFLQQNPNPIQSEPDNEIIKSEADINIKDELNLFLQSSLNLIKTDNQNDIKTISDNSGADKASPDNPLNNNNLIKPVEILNIKKELAQLIEQILKSDSQSNSEGKSDNKIDIKKNLSLIIDNIRNEISKVADGLSEENKQYSNIIQNFVKQMLNENGTANNQSIKLTDFKNIEKKLIEFIEAYTDNNSSDKLNSDFKHTIFNATNNEQLNDYTQSVNKDYLAEDALLNLDATEKKALYSAVENLQNELINSNENIGIDKNTESDNKNLNEEQDVKNSSIQNESTGDLGQKFNFDFNIFGKSNDINELLNKSVELGKLIENQIVKNVMLSHEEGKKEFEIQLEPHKLGKILIKMNLTDSGMDIKILTSNSNVKDILASQAAQMQTVIKEQGVKLNDMNIVHIDLSNQFSNSFHSGHEQQEFSRKNSFKAKDEYEQYSIINEISIDNESAPLLYSNSVEYIA